MRFLSNPSTGKMGVAVARAAWYRGASVTLVLGPVSLTNLSGFEVVRVVSAEEMKEAVLSRSGEMEYIVKAAAVGDYRPASYAGEKIKRSGSDTLRIDPSRIPTSPPPSVPKKTGQVLISLLPKA